MMEKEKNENVLILETIAKEVFQMPEEAVDGFVASCVFMILMT